MWVQLKGNRVQASGYCRGVEDPLDYINLHHWPPVGQIYFLYFTQFLVICVSLQNMYCTVLLLKKSFSAKLSKFPGKKKFWQKNSHQILSVGTAKHSKLYFCPGLISVFWALRSTVVFIGLFLFISFYICSFSALQYVIHFTIITVL